MQLYLLSVKTSLWMVSPPSSGELCLVELPYASRKGEQQNLTPHLSLQV